MVLPFFASEEDLIRFTAARKRKRQKGAYFCHKNYLKNYESLKSHSNSIEMARVRTTSHNKSDNFGSFRTIHTANVKDNDNAFPLRSVSPIKPFRRGVYVPNKFIDGNADR